MILEPEVMKSVSKGKKCAFLQLQQLIHLLYFIIINVAPLFSAARYRNYFYTMLASSAVVLYNVLVGCCFSMPVLIYVSLLNSILILSTIFICRSKKKTKAEESIIERSVISSLQKKTLASKSITGKQKIDKASNQIDAEIKQEDSKLKSHENTAPATPANSAASETNPAAAATQTRQSQQPAGPGQLQRLVSAAAAAAQATPARAQVPHIWHAPKVEKTVVLSISDKEGNSKKSNGNMQETSKRLGGEDSKRDYITPRNNTHKELSTKKKYLKEETKTSNFVKDDDKTTDLDETQKSIGMTLETQKTETKSQEAMSKEGGTQKTEISVNITKTRIKKEESSMSNVENKSSPKYSTPSGSNSNGNHKSGGSDKGEKEEAVKRTRKN
uniref:G_PROTEIN_RECEP_F1_2 domain-containing protein n=1 Tax=Ascaris lumbricoides TaxID=6252 RepID=A0A0M3I713_ASCLU